MHLLGSGIVFIITESNIILEGVKLLSLMITPILLVETGLPTENAIQFISLNKGTFL